ncbi:MAG: Glu-tRNA(Gln) amidotransferase subunit GatD [Candidatus Anstonellales archaeon]
MKKIRFRIGEKWYDGILLKESKGEVSIKLESGYNITTKPDEIKLLGEQKDEKLEKDENKEGKPYYSEGGIAILGAGGTIASKVEYLTGAVYPSLSPAELVSQFPEIKGIANIEVHPFIDIFSEDVTPQIWLSIAQECSSLLKEGKPIVLLHGTDMMHYTGAALSFMLNPLPHPIVMVGSQRSSDRPSSDNRLNLLNSVFSATQPFGEVSICMHSGLSDNSCALHRANRARKMHSSAREAFKSINSPPLAEVDYSKRSFKPLSKLREQGLLKERISFNPNVYLLYITPFTTAKDVEKLSDKDGIVIAGTGLGHLPTNPFKIKGARSLLEPIKELISSGVHVFMSTQAIYGRVNLNVYTTGRLLKEAGVMGHLSDMTPETALVKLGWVLSQTKKREEVEKMMLSNLAGEMSERTELPLNL